MYKLVPSQPANKLHDKITHHKNVPKPTMTFAPRDQELNYKRYINDDKPMDSFVPSSKSYYHKFNFK